MDAAIHILLQSIENVKAEIAASQIKMEAAFRDVETINGDLNFLDKRRNELESAIEILKGKTNEPTTVKTKKIKR